MENHSNISDEFVSWEIASKMKELGFDEPCFGYFDPVNNLCIYQEEDYFLSTDVPNIQLNAPL